MLVDHDRLPIFMYHRLLEDDASPSEFPPSSRPYCLPRTVFIEQMNYLKANGYQGIPICDIKEKAHAKSIGITFDDGLDSDCMIACKELKKLGFCATFYIISGYVGKKGYMGWDEILELQRQGMEIGSHTVTHPCLLDLNQDEIIWEMKKSKEQLEEQLGNSIEAFGVPFGFVNQGIIDAALQVGYQTVTTSQAQMAVVGRVPQVYGRYGIRQDDSLMKFAAIVHQKPMTLFSIWAMEVGKTLIKQMMGRRVWLAFRELYLGKKY